MTDHLYFDPQRIGEVIAVDAIAVKRSDFLATHTPYRNLRYAESGPIDTVGKRISEDGILHNMLLDRLSRHQFILVLGANGSGKSHLIRWLHERYKGKMDPGSEVVLLISRAQNTLKGAIEQLAKLDILGDDLDELKRLEHATTQLSEDNLHTNIALAFAAIAKEADRKRDKTCLQPFDLRRVYDFLVDVNVQQHLSGEGKALQRIASKLSSDDITQVQAGSPEFDESDFLLDTRTRIRMRNEGANANAQSLAEDMASQSTGPRLRQDMARFLNSRLSSVTQSLIEFTADDIQRLFIRVRERLRLQNRNLTLFIEDITSFRGIDNALVEALVTEHTSTALGAEICRLTSVVGTTDGFYSTSFPDNLKDRVTARVFMDTEQRDSASDWMVEMAARYINAISLPQSDLDRWADSGDRELDLPIAQKNVHYDWAAFQLPEGNRSVSLFPFNRAALMNIFDGLRPNARTPREFLRTLSALLTEFNSPVTHSQFPSPDGRPLAHITIPSFRFTGHSQQIQRQAGDNAPRMEVLLTCWGDATAFRRIDENGVAMLGGLPIAVFEAFGLSMVDGIEEGGRITPEVQPIPRSTQPPPTDPDSGQQLDAVSRDLERWASGESLVDYEQHRTRLASLFVDAIDWQSEGFPAYLVTAGGKEGRISIEGQVGAVRGSISIPRSKTTQRALLALAAYDIAGGKSWDIEGATTHLANLRYWLKEITPSVVSAVRSACGAADDSVQELARRNLYIQFYWRAIAGDLSPGMADPEKLILRLVSQPPTPVLDSLRSDLWRRMQEALGDTSVSGHLARLETHRHYFLHSFNLWQGSPSDSGVPFLNAPHLLQAIDDMIAADCPTEALQISDPSLPDTDFAPRSVVKVLKDHADRVLLSETKLAWELLDAVNQHLGEGFSQNDSAVLLGGAQRFLASLREVGESYDSNKLRALTDGSLTAGGLVNAMAKVTSALSQNTNYMKWLHFSANPCGELRPYAQLLDDLASLVAEKRARFERRTNDIETSGSSDSSVLELEVRELLSKLGGDENAG